MADEPVIELLDSFIEAMLSGGPQLSAPVPWIDVVSRLRHLPNENFKKRLKTELQRRTTMPQLATKPASAAARSVTPYITVANGDRLIEFLKETFGAEERERDSKSQGNYPAEVQIGDFTLVVDRSDALGIEASLSALKVYVANCDVAYKAALGAGAVSLAAPATKPYGERSCLVRDESGNIFGIATPTSPGKKESRVLPCLFPPKGRPYLDFLKSTFGAEETEFFESRGHLLHAAFHIGDTKFEMADLPRGWKREASAYIIRVPDIDATWERAMSAGATSVRWPAHRPNGGREAALQDPAGYIWYPVESR
jgi:PhnB protein